MNIFFTKERKIIIFVGLILFLFFAILGLGNYLPEKYNDLSINLAASSITILFTALFVDYQNHKSFEKRIRLITKSGIRKIDNLLSKLEIEISTFTGFKINTEDDASKPLDLLKKVKKNIKEHLKSLELTKNKNNIVQKTHKKREIDNLLNNINVLSVDLQSIIDIYSSALPHKIYERSVLLGDGLDRVKAASEIYSKQKDKSDVFLLSATLWSLTQKIIQIREAVDLEPDSQINDYESVLG